MPRGPSELQRYILAEAGARARVYYADVLEGFFGWRPRSEAGQAAGGSGAGPGGRRFSLAEVGEADYRKGMATLSRSVARLAARGLVTRWAGARPRWAAVSLTDAGRAWVAADGMAGEPPP